MTLRMLLAAALLAAATPAWGQATIAPGMAADEVHARFGAPATTRTDGAWTYLFYHNGCPVRCGSDDVVFLRDGRVVAAVLRTGARRITGPAAYRALDAAGGGEDNGGAVREEGGSTVIRVDGRERDRGEGPARVGGVRVEGGREGGEEAREGGSTIIVRPEDAPARPLRRSGAGDAAADTAAPGDTLRLGRGRPGDDGPTPSQLGSPRSATDDDDRRRAREGRVDPNTVRGNVSPDTMNDRRRQRERQVQPRTNRPRNP